MSSSLHAEATVVDGLMVCKWDRGIFEEMHTAGITAANCTVSIWDDFADTMENIAAFKRWFDEHDDLIRPIETTGDIRRAKDERRVGIIIGFQNLGAIEGRLSYLRLFRELGLRIAQLAYNTQNLIGAGCYESSDSGLTDLGREVVSSMNELGILVDLSHVGQQTSKDAIEHSQTPVAYSHTCPAAVHDHPRNKTDEEMRFIADHGGFVGVNILPWFLRADGEATLDDFVDAIGHTLNVVGEDHVGIGTDFMQGHGADYLAYLRSHQGRGPLITPLPEKPLAQTPEGLDRVADFPRITEAMERRGWSEERIRKVLGENWLRLLHEVWGA